MQDNQTPTQHPIMSQYDLTSMAVSQFDQLEALFKAITACVNNEGSQPKANLCDVSAIGQYLCQSWGGLYDSELDMIKSNQAIKPVLATPPKPAPTTVTTTSSPNNDNTVVNTKALHGALYELLELNSFIADISRLLQQEQVMKDESIVTQSCSSNMGATIETASRKQSELIEVIEQAIGTSIHKDHHSLNAKLLDMPSESHVYYDMNGGLKHA